MPGLNSLKQFNISGTTSANASEAMRTKKENKYRSSFVWPLGFSTRGIYFSSILRGGFQYVKAEAEQKDNSSSSIVPSFIKAVRISPNKVVEAYLDANSHLWARGGIINGIMEVSWGWAVEVTSRASSSVDICSLNDNESFAISYIDDNNTGIVIIGKVDSSGYASIESVRNLTEGACYKYGTSVSISSPGYLIAVFQKLSDEAAYAVAFRLENSLFLDVGDELRIEDSALYPKLCQIGDCLNLVAYQDGDTTNDPVTVNTITLDKNTIELTLGAKTSIAGTAAAATCIDCKSSCDDYVLISWIDSSLPHMRAASVKGDALTWGTEVELSAVTSAYLSIDVLDSDKYVAVWENTGKSNYLYSIRVTRSENTLTVPSNSEDPAVEAESIYNSVVALNSNDILIQFSDGGNSNYFTEQYGKYLSNLIDIRSSSASISFNGFIFSLGRDGLGVFGQYQKTGTTHATADTPMETKPTNPFSKQPAPLELICLFSDNRQYIEDDGSVAPLKSGIAKTSLDVRSTTTAQAFTMQVIKVQNTIRSVNL
jgi:hypothetical protein